MYPDELVCGIDNLVTAAAVVSILPILAIFLFFQKWVVQGVVMSGLKG